MNFRVARIEDIKQIHVVRNAVIENALSNPDLISHDDYVEFLTLRGKGWLCEIDQQIVGFSIVDLQDDNVWALFLLPKFEGKGIGKQLQTLMLDWYFSNGKEHIWLGTSPKTRAAEFYKKTGWIETGWHGTKELKFEMTKKAWIAIKG